MSYDPVPGPPDVAAPLWTTQAAFQAAWEASSDAMVLSDPTGQVLVANAAYFTLYGYGPEEVLGQPFSIIFPPEVRAWAEAEYRRTFAETDVAPTVESTVERKDGTRRIVEVRYSFVYENGRRVAMLSTIRDVTERTELLQRERDAHAETAQAVRARDEVFALVTHDLKNPLTAIKGLAQVLRRRAARALPAESGPEAEKLLQGLDQIDALVTRMTEQIDELLGLARTAPGTEPTLQPTDLAALAQRKVEEVQRSAPRHEIRLRSEVPALVGSWDAGRLERALDNLLANAVKYSPAGGPITVRIAHETAEDATGRDWAVLGVQDQGIGIPAADLPHIFEWYRRGENVPQEVAGTGLGLAAVQRIVEQHGGSISVASAEGAGTTFTMRLPL